MKKFKVTKSQNQSTIYIFLHRTLITKELPLFSLVIINLIIAVVCHLVLNWLVSTCLHKTVRAILYDCASRCTDLKCHWMTWSPWVVGVFLVRVVYACMLYVHLWPRLVNNWRRATSRASLYDSDGQVRPDVRWAPHGTVARSGQ